MSNIGTTGIHPVGKQRHTLIRIAKPADVDHIDRLLRALAESTGESDSYAGDKHALKQFGFSEQKLYRTLLVEQAHAVVGLCTFFAEFSTWRCKPGLYVQDLYIDPLCRGTGLGVQLLSEAIRYAHAEWQASYMRLSVLKTNQRGNAFYDKLAFNVDRKNDLMILEGNVFDLLKSAD